MSNFDILINEFGATTKVINGGKFSSAVIDLNYVHVVPVFLTALMQAFGLLEDKVDFELNLLNSEMFLEVLQDPGYQKLVKALKQARDTESAKEELKGLIPGYYVYDARENEYSVIYYDFGDYVSIVSNVNPYETYSEKLVLDIKYLGYKETKPRVLHFPIYRRGDLKLMIDKSFDNVTLARNSRSELVRVFYKFAPFNICRFPISSRVVNLGLKPRKEETPKQTVVTQSNVSEKKTFKIRSVSDSIAKAREQLNKKN